MPQIVEVPGLGNVEFPDGTPTATMEAAIKRALLEGKGQQQSQDIPVGLSMGTGFEAPAFEPPAGPAAFLARTVPGLAPPLVGAPLSAGGEALAQFLEGGKIDPIQIGLAGAVPPAAAATGRLVRGLGRTATRLIPGMFEKAQRAAQETGEALVQGLRPAEDVAALAQSARAAGTDLIPATNVQRIIGQIKTPITPANPKLAAVKTTVENLKGVLQAGKVSLDDLEAIRRDIGPLLQSKAAPAELRGIYGAIVTDLEQEAVRGGVGASLARQTATAFKQDLGAARVAELLEKATTRRVFGGADLPALDISKFARSINDPKIKKQLLDQLGADALRTVEEFVARFKSLPPTMAYTGWNSLLTVLGGGVGMLSGRPIAGPVIGVLSPEILRNMAAVGANPQALNAVMISVSQGIRAASLTPAPLGARAGIQP